MSGGAVVAIVLAVVVAIVSGAVLVALVALMRALRELRVSVAALRADVVPLVNEMAATVTTAAYEVERVDRIVNAAESFEQHRDGAFRTFANPVVRMLGGLAGARAAARRVFGRPARGRDQKFPPARASRKAS